MTIDAGWLAGVSDSEEAAALTVRLAEIRSTPGEEDEVQQEIAGWFAEQGADAGIAVERQELPDGRCNVIATVTNGDGPTLLLNGHVDTVLAADGWQHDPWTPQRHGDTLTGLGVCDMKSGLAAGMLATRALARSRESWRGTLVFSAVVDEEAYSAGARALVERGLRADACVVLEANWQPVIGGVGKVLARVDIIGRAAHGGWPAEGINAAVEGAKLVARIDELPLGTHPRVIGTQCVLSFHAGSEQYVITVPERARVLVNRHTVPGEDGQRIVADLRALAASLDSPARFEVAIDPPFYPAWETDPADPLVTTFAAAFEAELGHAPDFSYNQGVADTNYFATDLGIPCVQFGPRGGQYHAAGEWVDVPSIGAVTRIVLRTALGVLA